MAAGGDWSNRWKIPAYDDQDDRESSLSSDDGTVTNVSAESDWTDDDNVEVVNSAESDWTEDNVKVVDPAEQQLDYSKPQWRHRVNWTDGESSSEVSSDGDESIPGVSSSNGTDEPCDSHGSVWGASGVENKLQGLTVGKKFKDRYLSMSEDERSAMRKAGRKLFTKKRRTLQRKTKSMQPGSDTESTEIELLETANKRMEEQQLAMEKELEELKDKHSQLKRENAKNKQDRLDARTARRKQEVIDKYTHRIGVQQRTLKALESEVQELYKKNSQLEIENAGRIRHERKMKHVSKEEKGANLVGKHEKVTCKPSKLGNCVKRDAIDPPRRQEKHCSERRTSDRQELRQEKYRIDRRATDRREPQRQERSHRERRSNDKHEQHHPEKHRRERRAIDWLKCESPAKESGKRYEHRLDIKSKREHELTWRHKPQELYDSELEVGHGTRRREVQPPVFTSKGPWKDFYLQFEACRRFNKWSDSESAIRLYTSCQGGALSVLSVNDVSPGDLTYEEMVTMMENEFGPRQCIENYFMELNHREQMPGESLHDLGKDIKRLVALAHPRTDKVEKDRIAREHYKRAVADPDLRKELFRAAPETLDAAIKKAEVVESFCKSELSRRRSRTYSSV